MWVESSIRERLSLPSQFQNGKLYQSIYAVGVVFKSLFQRLWVSVLRFIVWRPCGKRQKQSGEKEQNQNHVNQKSQAENLGSLEN